MQDAMLYIGICLLQFI